MILVQIGMYYTYYYVYTIPKSIMQVYKYSEHGMRRSADDLAD